MAMNGNEGGSAYPPNPDVKSGSCLIAGFQPLTVVHPSYWNAYKTESGATTRSAWMTERVVARAAKALSCNHVAPTNSRQRGQAR